MPSLSSQPVSGEKEVRCTECAGTCQVPQRAMSIFCPHCNERLILEDYNIKTYRGVSRLATCGDVVVEKKGQVSASSIKAGNVIVRGKVQGDITARNVVRISKTGSLRGDIEASKLEVESGAVLNGFFRIGDGPADQRKPFTDQAQKAAPSGKGRRG